MVKITVKDYDQFLITLRHVTERESSHFNPGKETTRVYLKCVESPGDYLEKQHSELSRFEDFLSHLRDWRGRVEVTLIRDDLVQAQISRIRDGFEEDLASHVEDANAHFSAKEKEYFFSKIDELGQKLEAALSAQFASEAETKSLRSMIAEMKAAMQLPKKAALRVIGAKFAVFIAVTTCQTLLADGVNKTLSLLFSGHP